MSPLTKQQLNQIRDERREQIKRASLKVFARRGILGTTMKMIATEAGISQGLSYSYFKSKDDLFTELIQDAMEEYHAAISKLKHLPGTPIEQIRTLTRELLNEDNKHSFMLIHQAQTSDGVPEKAKQIMEQYSSQVLIDQLVPIFSKGQQSGQFCAGNPQKLLFWYFSILTGLMLQDLDGIKEYEIPDVDILMKIIMK